MARFPYEGGYRLPYIVFGHSKVPAERTSDAIFATIDFLPTFANLCGFEVPKDCRIDGIDQTKLLLGMTGGRKTSTSTKLATGLANGSI